MATRPMPIPAMFVIIGPVMDLPFIAIEPRPRAIRGDPPMNHSPRQPAVGGPPMPRFADGSAMATRPMPIPAMFVIIGPVMDLPYIASDQSPQAIRGDPPMNHSPFQPAVGGPPKARFADGSAMAARPMPTPAMFVIIGPVTDLPHIAIDPRPRGNQGDIRR